MKAHTKPHTIITDYSSQSISTHLKNLYNMRLAWYNLKGIDRPEEKLFYALNRLGLWIPRCGAYTHQNLINKVAACADDIKLILPSAFGKQANVRQRILNDIQYCMANQKEVQHDTYN